MIVDSSAVVAVLTGEPGWQALDRAARDAASVSMSAATLLEVSIVIDSRPDPVLARQLDDLLGGWGVAIEPLTVDHARVARSAYRDFGRGSGHPAKLNFGDCFSYALAAATGEPLLFVGQDFVHTDVIPAV